MNRLGDEGGRQYYRQPYADYLGYRPVNTADSLRDPGRWQPDVVTTGNGIFRVQEFVTPQYGVTRPYSYGSPTEFDPGLQRSVAQRRAAEFVAIVRISGDLLQTKVFVLPWSIEHHVARAEAEFRRDLRHADDAHLEVAKHLIRVAFDRMALTAPATCRRR